MPADCCKIRVVQCKLTIKNGPAGLDMHLRGSPNYVYQLTINNSLYQTVTQMLAQPLYGYRYVICTCSAPMCCHGVYVQGLHSTGHQQHPTQELAIRAATLTLATNLQFPHLGVSFSKYYLRMHRAYWGAAV